jgi:hypothetical protein
VLAVIVALLPVVVAVARALRSDWIPIGDDALVEIRSRDVFSAEHFPLLGTWSSASLSAGIDLNHPGPLLFVLLAPFVAVFGGPAGVAIGIGVLNAAAIVGCAMVGYRALGRTGSLAATLVAGALSWTLGSVLLTDPWNPHPLVLPCLLLLLLTWDVAQGDLAALPWLVAVGSLCLQVHLGYAYLVPSMLLVAVVAAGFELRRRWRLDDSGHAADKVLVRRTAGWARRVGALGGSDRRAVVRSRKGKPGAHPRQHRQRGGDHRAPARRTVGCRRRGAPAVVGSRIVRRHDPLHAVRA